MLDQPQSRLEVLLVGQAHGDQFGTRQLDHLIKVGVRLGTVGSRTARGTFGVPAEDPHQLCVRAFREDSGVLLAPRASADDRYPHATDPR